MTRAICGRFRQAVNVLAALAAILMAGCGGGGTEASPEGAHAAAAPYTGRLIDSGVANLNYRTSTRSGRTGPNGEFGYDVPGEPITFLIGSQWVGTGSTDATLHIFKLDTARLDAAGTYGVRIAQVLQTADADGDPANGIQIPEAAHTVSSGTTSNVLLAPQTTFNAFLSALRPTPGAVITSPEAAAAHAQAQLEVLGCPIAPTIYRFDGQAVDTTGLACVRRAELAAYFDWVEPSLRRNAETYLLNDFLANGVGITDKTRDDIANRSTFKAGIEVLVTGLDYAAGAVEVGEAKTLAAVQKGMASAAKSGLDVMSKTIAVACSAACTSEEQRKLYEVARVSLEVIGRTLECRGGTLSACVEMVSKPLEVTAKRLFPDDLPRSAAIALATAKVAADFAKGMQDAATLIGAKDPSAVYVLASDSIRFVMDAYTVVNPNSMTASRTALDNFVLVAGDAVDAWSSCAALTASRTLSAGVSNLARCADKFGTFAFDKVTAIGVMWAYLEVAPAMEEKGNAYRVASMALREFLATTDYAQLMASRGKPGVPVGDFLRAMTGGGVEDRAFMARYLGFVRDAYFPGARTDLAFAAEQVANAFWMIGDRARRLKTGALGTCAGLGQGTVVANGKAYSGAPLIAVPGSTLSISTSFAGSGGVSGYVVNWGDGESSDLSILSTQQHTFAAVGNYRAVLQPVLRGLNGTVVCPAKGAFIRIATPSVKSVEPTVVTPGRLTTIVVRGADLPTTTEVSMADATCGATTVDASGAVASVQCTPSAPAGAKKITLRTDRQISGGSVYSDSLTVTVTTVPVSTITGRVPHSGTPEQQCHRESSNLIVGCTSPEALALSGSGKQDGMYARVNAMTYSLVAKATGGTYSSTECVMDNITGLVWEGKPASGVRSVGARYTNQGDGADSDASGYVASVNATGLCGFNDWRLPTPDELQTLVNYGRAFPAIDINWFGGTDNVAYWTSAPNVATASFAWAVYFDVGYVSNDRLRGTGYAVRLVRAGQ